MKRVLPLWNVGSDKDFYQYPEDSDKLQMMLRVAAELAQPYLSSPPVSTLSAETKRYLEWLNYCIEFEKAKRLAISKLTPEEKEMLGIIE